MRKPASRLFMAAVLTCLCMGTTVRADPVTWGYNWTPSATAIYATNDPSLGSITLSDEKTGTAAGSSYIVATNLQTVSSASASNPAVFNNATYHLTLTIFDGKLANSMVFTGNFNGTLSSNSALVLNNFVGPTTQSVVLGMHQYTVTIGPFSPPGPPTAKNSGSISALAKVTVSAAPEPSSMALAGFGLSLCGAWWVRLRRKTRKSILGMA